MEVVGVPRRPQAVASAEALLGSAEEGREDQPQGERRTRRRLRRFLIRNGGRGNQQGNEEERREDTERGRGAEGETSRGRDGETEEARRGRSDTGQRGQVNACGGLYMMYLIGVVVSTGIVLGRAEKPWGLLGVWLVVNAVVTSLYRGLKLVTEGHSTGPISSWVLRSVTWLGFVVFLGGLILVARHRMKGNVEVYKLSVALVAIDLAQLILALSMACFICLCAPLGMSGSRNRAATKAMIEKIGISNYKEGMFEEGTVCVICLEAYADGQRIRTLPCGGENKHSYHAQCVDRWLAHDKSCPVCKRDIDDGELSTRKKPTSNTQMSSLR